VTKLIRSPGFC